MPADKATSLDLQEQPGHLVRRLQQAHKLLWAELVPGDLTSPQFAVLDLLAQHPNTDQRTLGELAGMDRSTTAELIQRLASRGLVTRVKDVADARRNLLQLSVAGEKLFRRTLPGATRVGTELVEVLSEQDRREFLRILNRLVEAHTERRGNTTLR